MTYLLIAFLLGSVLMFNTVHAAEGSVMPGGGVGHLDEEGHSIAVVQAGKKMKPEDLDKSIESCQNLLLTLDQIVNIQNDLNSALELLAVPPNNQHQIVQLIQKSPPMQELVSFIHEAKDKAQKLEANLKRSQKLEDANFYVSTCSNSVTGIQYMYKNTTLPILKSELAKAVHKAGLNKCPKNLDSNLLELLMNPNSKIDVNGILFKAYDLSEIPADLRVVSKGRAANAELKELSYESNQFICTYTFRKFGHISKSNIKIAYVPMY